MLVLVTALIAGLSVVAADFGSKCSQQEWCFQGLPSLAIGTPLLSAGLGLTIAGGVLTHQGYRDASEVDARDFRYVYVPN